MLCDFLSMDNYVSFNSQLASIIGLHSAIYVSELINITRKATLKNKLTDNKYITVDREYITNRTTITLDEQYEIDKKLNKVGLVDLSDNPDIISIDLSTLVNLATSNDEDLIGKVNKLTKIKSTSGSKMTQRQHMFESLKAGIHHDNAELEQAYKDWVDGVCANPKGFLSKKAISVFQAAVDQYSERNLDVALKIIEIATINGYRDATWAINVFEKDYKAQFFKQYQPQNIMATQRQKQVLSDEVF